jgi:hypothetical protein
VGHDEEMTRLLRSIRQRIIRWDQDTRSLTFEYPKFIVNLNGFNDAKAISLPPQYLSRFTDAVIVKYYNKDQYLWASIERRRSPWGQYIYIKPEDEEIISLNCNAPLQRG